MPTLEGLSFSYALHELPPGRFPFRRWRWELWHGPRLEAAGWRITERDAAHALRVNAARVGHGLFGLSAPRIAPAAGGFQPGATLRVQAGGLLFSLVPKHLDVPEQVRA